jgi:hypothetical protein
MFTLHGVLILRHIDAGLRRNGSRQNIEERLNTYVERAFQNVSWRWKTLKETYFKQSPVTVLYAANNTMMRAPSSPRKVCQGFSTSFSFSVKDSGQCNDSSQWMCLVTLPGASCVLLSLVVLTLDSNSSQKFETSGVCQLRHHPKFCSPQHTE